MNGFIIALIVLAAGATGYILIRGVINMANGKDISGARSNQLMAGRVAFQAITIVLVLILFALGGRGLSS